MLAPMSEGWPGEEAVFAIGAASLARWPQFAAELEAAAPTPSPILSGRQSLTVALDSADAEDVRTIAEFVAAQGRQAELLDRAAIRKLEPSLSPRIRLGVLAPDEFAADNRLLCVALTQACAQAGVEFLVEPVADLAQLTADQIVVAAGWAAPKLLPQLPIRPVKGEVLRLKARPGAAPASARTIRGSVHGRASYLVPRADGMVIGATQYEAGPDTSVTVAGVRNLIADAEALMPGIGEYELAETIAGLRPVTPDALPIIDRVDQRVIVAGGHGRNGVLLAPLTADAVLGILDGRPLPEAASAALSRFAPSEKAGRAS
jgi:glycine oxidase